MTIFFAILLSLLTLGFIVYPLVRRSASATAVRKPVIRRPAPSQADSGSVNDEIEAQVMALRQAHASFCNKCGARLKADDRFCQRCGQRVN